MAEIEITEMTAEEYTALREEESRDSAVWADRTLTDEEYKEYIRTEASKEE